MADDEIGWVFGYGSLIWKVDFPTIEARDGHIHGYVRRLWQGSTDHRGTPAAPGRVLTLLTLAEHQAVLASTGVAELEHPAANIAGHCGLNPPVVAGVAYRLDPVQRQATLAQLDHREKCGYVREVVNVCAKSAVGQPPCFLRAFVYRATPDNDEFLGPPAPSAEGIAQHVLRSSGPSGPNLQYVERLHEALLARGLSDPHLESIVNEARRIAQAT